jgi:drug/metabolite transporter (DMT)-like permease
MADLTRSRRPWVPVALVFSTVLIQLASAWVLDTAADTKPGRGWTIIAAAVALAIGLNVVRFVIWGYTHRRFPLSQTYPLTALFFPCVLVLSWLKGDAIHVPEIAGTALITLGALVMGTRKHAAR